MSFVLPLNDSEKTQLLQIARNSILHHLALTNFASHKCDDPVLQQHLPVFVTLWGENRNLRGCIGQVENVHTPVCTTVAQCAVAAATRDYRFQPLNAEEMASLTIEISILSPPQAVQDIDDIEVGRHGLIIRQTHPQKRIGLLLPQVASSRNWNRRQFLEAVCQKAGLPLDAWRRAKLFMFESLVFEE